MNTKYKDKDKLLIFEITEEIDHHTTEKIRRKMDNEIERYLPKKIIFDFNQVTFMDSAGVGLLIGRYKLINMLGGKVKIANINTPVRKIFEMSGILKIMPEVKNNKKEAQYE